MRLLVWCLLLYIGYRLLKSALSAEKSTGAARRAVDEETVRDPICGVYLSRDDAVVGTLEGTRHYFCSLDCLEKFREQLDHTSQS